MKKIEFKKPASPTDAFIDMLGGGNTGNGDIVNLPADLLTPYPEQKTFRKYPEDKLIELSDNIKKVGILQPVIVRPYEKNGDTFYEILAGHNRTAAAKMAGLDTVPCIIKIVDDNTAKAIFVITNLNQRERLLYSEKAFAYKLLMESENGQENTAALIAQQNNESRRQIFRYIRLTALIPDLLDMVDSEEIPMIAGVNFSYLNEDSQQLLHEYITANEYKVKVINSEEIKDLCKDGSINLEILNSVFNKPRKKSKVHSLKLPADDIRQYFNELEDEEIIEKVLEIVKNHFDNNC